MHFQNLQEFFRVRQHRERALVLATVVETRGSTYSKAGERMLIDEHGIFQGMLSGGCLEGDLAIRAQQVLESGCPQSVTYDLSADDELWGLGVGCDGVMTVFLQALEPASAYEPFPTLCERQLEPLASVFALVIESRVPDIMAGAAVVVSGTQRYPTGITGDAAEMLAESATAVLESDRSAIRDHAIDGGTLRVFYSPISPIPRLLVLGAGLDAEPLVRFASELGWLCTVADHRAAYIDNNDFALAERLHCGPAGELATALPLHTFDLAIVMSHHLVSDRTYLRQLADTAIQYIGLLGPPGRKNRLMAELGDAARLLRHRLHGPAGIDLGGRGPAAIALSIVAEMQEAIASKGLLRASYSEGSSE